jgi:hypothetical protein
MLWADIPFWVLVVALVASFVIAALVICFNVDAP